MSKLMNMLLHNFNYGGRFVLISSSVQLNSCMEHLIQIIDFLSMKDNIHVHVLIKNSIIELLFLTLSLVQICFLSLPTSIIRANVMYRLQKCFHIIIIKNELDISYLASKLLGMPREWQSLAKQSHLSTSIPFLLLATIWKKNSFLKKNPAK